jgi:hypothetical protein
MKLIRVQSMFSMTPMYHMYKDSHMEESKRFMRHIKLISMNRRYFWMHLDVHEVVQGAVHVLHVPRVPHVCHTVIQSFRITGSVQQSYSLTDSTSHLICGL